MQPSASKELDVVYPAGDSHFNSEASLLNCSCSSLEVPLYFHGEFVDASRAAEQLLALAHVVGTRFYTPPGMVARLIRESDPVVTCAQSVVRWEGFSTCCSVYARVDMNSDAIDGSLVSAGTTNVDFGPAMRDALAAARTSPRCSVSIGSEFVEVTSSHTAVEKRVKIPRRWLQAFIEAQYHQTSMTFVCAPTPLEFRRFLQSLPKKKTRRPSFLEVTQRGLRLGFIKGIPFKGWERLSVLERLLQQTTSVQLFTNLTGATGWVLDLGDSVFTLLLSPEPARGFSGEGQALFHLSQEASPELDASISTLLGWRDSVPFEEILSGSQEPKEALDSALSALSARGQVGFDLHRNGFYRRELPFPWEDFEVLHSRLRSARKLLDQVRFEGGVAWVSSGEVDYRVRWIGDEPECHCPWFQKHGLERGPCKHILAAQWALRE